MKLGTAWYGFGELTYQNYFAIAAALGLRYVEVPLYRRELWTWYRWPAGVREVAAAAAEAGVTLVAGVAALDLAGPSRLGDLEQSTISYERAEARHIIDLGAALELEVIRLAEPRLLEGAEAAAAGELTRRYGAAYRELGDYAADRGLKLAIENFGYKADQICAVLEVANHPAVGTLYDPCNYYRHGEDPLEALKKLEGRVFYCHLKDASFRYPAEHPRELPLGHDGRVRPWWWIEPLGRGKLDWHGILRELARCYDGFVCLEHDIRDTAVAGTRIGIEFVQKLGLGISL